MNRKGGLRLLVLRMLSQSESGNELMEYKIPSRKAKCRISSGLSLTNPRSFVLAKLLKTINEHAVDETVLTISKGESIDFEQILPRSDLIELRIHPILVENLTQK